MRNNELGEGQGLAGGWLAGQVGGTPSAPHPGIAPQDAAAASGRRDLGQGTRRAGAWLKGFSLWL